MLSRWGMLLGSLALAVAGCGAPSSDRHVVVVPGGEPQAAAHQGGAPKTEAPQAASPPAARPRGCGEVPKEDRTCTVDPLCHGPKGTTPHQRDCSQIEAIPYGDSLRDIYDSPCTLQAIAARIDATIEIDARAALTLPDMQELAREYIQLATDQARLARELSWALLEGNTARVGKHKARLQELLLIEEQLLERFIRACRIVFP